MMSATTVLQAMPAMRAVPIGNAVARAVQNDTQGLPVGWVTGPSPAIWPGRLPTVWRAVQPWRRWLAKALVWLLGCSLIGCANLPAPVPREPTLALPASTATTLGRIAAESSPDEALSGFRLLPVGAFAIDTRLALIRRAERSIDVQYYLIQNDETGRFLLRSLRDAARRGVRVRLLMDDLYTSDSDEVLLGLAAQRNVEIRLFNPFPGGRGHFLTRFLASAHDFNRVNRRMHNKLLIVDGAMAVTGGRNIANEYFMRHALANFVDLDAFVIGALVPKLAELFDDYWNSPVVFPLHRIVPPPGDLDELLAQFDSATGPVWRRRPSRRPAPMCWATARCPMSWTPAGWAWCGPRPPPMPTHRRASKAWARVMGWCRCRTWNRCSTTCWI